MLADPDGVGFAEEAEDAAGRTSGSLLPTFPLRKSFTYCGRSLSRVLRCAMISEAVSAATRMAMQRKQAKLAQLAKARRQDLPRSYPPLSYHFVNDLVPSM